MLSFLPNTWAEPPHRVSSRRHTPLALDLTSLPRWGAFVQEAKRSFDRKYWLVPPFESNNDFARLALGRPPVVVDQQTGYALDRAIFKLDRIGLNRLRRN